MPIYHAHVSTSAQLAECFYKCPTWIHVLYRFSWLTSTVSYHLQHLSGWCNEPRHSIYSRRCSSTVEILTQCSECLQTEYAHCSLAVVHLPAIWHAISAAITVLQVPLPRQPCTSAGLCPCPGPQTGSPTKIFHLHPHPLRRQAKIPAAIPPSADPLFIPDWQFL
jgi:hypothetical protein